jgi:histidine decarboxylase
MQNLSKRGVAAVVATVLFLLASMSVGLASPLTFDRTAISPYDDYCDGYGMPGATGNGYVSVLKVSTGVTDKTDDMLLDGIISYDRAEAADAYLGQINMITASSFNGIMGNIWGYDLAVAEEIRNNTQEPLFTVQQYDGSPMPVYDAAPLLQAGQALFGTSQARRFPPAPGSQMICANKSATAYRPQQGVPEEAKGEAYGVWSYLSISLAKDRGRAASLFIEDVGVWTKNDNQADLVRFLDEHRRAVVQSALDCGRNQRAVYDRTYIAYAYVMMQPGQVGTALTVAPYVTLARKAIPAGGFDLLRSMTLREWENALGLQ